MKNAIKTILILTGFIISMAASGAPVFITDTEVNISGGTGDAFSVEISSYYPDPAHNLVTEPVSIRTTNTFDIDLFIERVLEDNLLVPAVLVPFSRLVDLGSLDAGNYSVNIRYYLDQELTGNFRHSFSVRGFSPAVAAPIPPSIWLLAGSLLSLFLLRRRKKVIN